MLEIWNVGLEHDFRIDLVRIRFIGRMNAEPDDVGEGSDAVLFSRLDSDDARPLMNGLKVVHLEERSPAQQDRKMIVLVSVLGEQLARRDSRLLHIDAAAEVVNDVHPVGDKTGVKRGGCGRGIGGGTSDHVLRYALVAPGGRWTLK